MSGFVRKICIFCMTVLLGIWSFGAYADTCNVIIIQRRNSSVTLGSVTRLYKKTGDAQLYVDASCTTPYSTDPNVIPTRSGYTFRGFYVTEYAEAETNNNAPTDQILDTNGAATTYNSSWTISGPASLYPAWAMNCEPAEIQAENHVSCTLDVSTDGAVNYTVECEPGYPLIYYNSDDPLLVYQGCYYPGVVTLDANGGTAGSVTRLYQAWDNALYTDEACTIPYTRSNVIPTRSGYTFRGFYYHTQHSDVSSDSPAYNHQVLDTSGAETAYSWLAWDNTIYAAWAQDCPASVSNGTCLLDVSTDGAVDYTTTCDAGYTIVWDNTANPICVIPIVVTLDANGGMAGSVTTLYFSNGNLYTDQSLTTLYTASNLIPTRSGYTFRGFYMTQYSDVSSDSAAPNDQIINTNGSLSRAGRTILVALGTTSATIYAAWARDCNSPVSNGACSLDVSTNGAVDYETTCDTGYTIVANTKNTYNPTCNVTKYGIKYELNGGMAMLDGDYTSIEYISNDGSGYLDLGFKTKSTMRVESVFKRETLDASALFGNYRDTATTSDFVFYPGASGVNSSAYYASTTKTDMEIQLNTTDWHTVVFDGFGRTLKLNDTTKALSGTQTFTTAHNMPLFARYYNSYGYLMTGAVKSFTVYDSGAMYYNGVPAVRKSDGACGLYDTVGHSFVTSSSLVNCPTVDVLPQTYTDGVGATISGVPVRANSTFDGWCTDSSLTQCGPTQVIASNATGNKTFYAKWICNTGYTANADACVANTYTVSFSPNNGTGGQSTDVTATYGATMPTISTTAPTRAGYTFMGWYDKTTYTSGKQYYTSAGVSAHVWDKTANATLYAGWKARTYTVTLDANAVDATAGTASVTATYNSNMPTSGVTMPTRSGFTFAGYYDTAATTGGTQYYTAAGASAHKWNKAQNTTLYARWTPNLYTVTLNANAADATSGTSSVTAVYGSTMPTSGVTMPTRSGYMFTGYYDTSATTGGTQYYTAAGASANTWDKTTDTTLYARWDAVPAAQFTVTTTNMAANTTFIFNMSAAGDFYVDWGDGTVEHIVRTNTTPVAYSHTYTTGGVKTIGFAGLATEYNTTNSEAGPIVFGANEIPGFENASTPGLVAGISGSLGAIFPTLGQTDNLIPRFYGTFFNCTNLTGSIPSGLFSGVTGARAGMFEWTFFRTGLTGAIPTGLFSGISGAVGSMFLSTFRDSPGLTSIPADLFSGISGSAAGMFMYTFDGCTGLSSIPTGLFSHVSGAAADMFNGTFGDCTGLTGANAIPSTLFSGISGAAERMFGYTFSGCTSLTTIPETLFSGVSGTAPFLFYETFSNCSSLSSYVPPKLFRSSVITYDANNNMMTNIFSGTNLATSCDSYNLTQYTTGFESYWGGKVSCAPAALFSCVNPNPYMGGSGTISASPIFVEPGEPFTFPAATGCIAPNHYNLNGITWTCDNSIPMCNNHYWDASSGSTMSGGWPANQTTSVQFYAYYQPDIYTITLDANGGTPGSQGAVYEKYNAGWATSLNGQYTSVFPTLITTQMASRNNYVLTGYWSQDGNTKYINADGTLATGINHRTFGANATIYAGWERPVYTVQLDDNGGSNGSGYIYEKYDTGWSLSQDGPFTANPVVAIPTKAGYTFSGYYTSGDVQLITSGGVVQASNTFTSANGVTLYAHWNAITFNVAYFAGTGGSGTGPTPNPASCTYGGTCNAATNSYTAPVGKAFAGWACTIGGNSCGTIAAGGSLSTITTTNNATVTLTAIWENEQYTAHFTCENNTYSPYVYSGTAPSDMTGITYQETITLPSPNVCTNNYPDSGWIASPADQWSYRCVDANNSVLGTGTAYAGSWTWPRAGNCNFTANGGYQIYHAYYHCDETSNTVSLDQTIDYTNRNTVRPPTASDAGCTAPLGHHFTGWKLGSSDTILQPGQYGGNNALWPYAQHVHLRAQWEPDTYNISWSCGDYGTGTPSGNSFPTTIDYGATLTFPANTVCQAPTGYEFTSWVVDIGANEYLPGDTLAWPYVIGSAIIAHYEPANYTVTYSCGTGATGTAPSSATAEYNSSFTPANPTNCQKVGYSFDDWLVVGFNLYDSTAVTPNKYYNNSLVYSNVTNTNLSDYMPVIAGQTYTWKANRIQTGGNLRINWFDANKNILSQDKQASQTQITVTAPANAAYARFSYPTAYYDSEHVFARASSVSGFTPYEASANRDAGTAFTWQYTGGDKTFIAQWTPAIYTITLDANGGTVGSLSAIYEQYNVGWSQVPDGPFGVWQNLTNAQKAYKTGYTFTGYWSQDGNTQYMDANGALTTGVDETTFASNAMIYAGWTPNTYILNYNLRGGEYGEYHPSSATYDVEFTVSHPTHEHGTFAGWRIRGLESGIDYFFDGVVQHNDGGSSVSGVMATRFKNLRAAGNVAFLATWTCDVGYSGINCEPNTYTMQYVCSDEDARFNFTGAAPTATNPVSYNQNVTMAADPYSDQNGCRKIYGTQGNADYCDDCFTFGGWTIDAESAALEDPDLVHTANSTVSWGNTYGTNWCIVNTSGLCSGYSANDTFLVNANYTPKQYNITYMYATSPSSPNASMPANYTYSVGTPITNADQTAPAHATFNGWCTDLNDATTCVTAGQPITIGNRDHGDRTYYAKWSCDSGYDLSYNANNEPVCSLVAITCSAGYYLAAGDTTCSECIAGNYCPGGTFMFNENLDQTITVCPTNTYSNVAAAVCTACATVNGYTNSGPNASDHAYVSSCKTTCSAGQCVRTAGAACVNVGAGGWATGGVVSQGETLTCGACPVGTTTIGYGAGADEASDCGRVLHVGENHVYLRGNRKTDRTLNVKIGNDTYYGNMCPVDINMSDGINHYLKIKLGNTVYSVYDDSAANNCVVPGA